MSGGAILSPCGTWRWVLWRDIAEEGLVAALCGVNPSTADAKENDATIRKDIGFAKVHGWRRIIKINEFAFRATDVNRLKTAFDPCGPENDAHIRRALDEADVFVACWGSLAKLPKPLRNRWRAIVRMAQEAGKPIMCFGTANDGQPRHTLMLAYETPLVPWSAPA
jgi:hypothetical protein